MMPRGAWCIYTSSWVIRPAGRFTHSLISLRRDQAPALVAHRTLACIRDDSQKLYRFSRLRLQHLSARSSSWRASRPSFAALVARHQRLFQVKVGVSTRSSMVPLLHEVTSGVEAAAHRR
jgi:hypothetical protein